jgi:hypothetical protein
LKAGAAFVFDKNGKYLLHTPTAQSDTKNTIRARIATTIHRSGGAATRAAVRSATAYVAPVFKPVVATAAAVPSPKVKTTSVYPAPPPGCVLTTHISGLQVCTPSGSVTDWLTERRTPDTLRIAFTGLCPLGDRQDMILMLGGIKTDAEGKTYCFAFDDKISAADVLVVNDDMYNGYTRASTKFRAASADGVVMIRASTFALWVRNKGWM